MNIKNNDNTDIQGFVSNELYEILTPFGWEDFSGVMVNNFSKDAVTITVESGDTITATIDHRFYHDGIEKKASDFAIGDLIDCKDVSMRIISIEKTILDKSFDIFNSSNHQIYANRFRSHQCDEFAFVRPTIAKEFWTAIQPTLSTGGGCILTSTPFSDEDQFAELWFGATNFVDEDGNQLDLDGAGRNEFKAVKYIWKDHPERDEKWAKGFIASLGMDRFRREFECEFIPEDETLISGSVLANLSYREELRKSGNVYWYEEILPNHQYVVALDPAMGAGNGDYSAIQVYRLPDFVQVAEWRSQKAGASEQTKLLLQLLHFINNTLKNDPDQEVEPEIFWTVENNSVGQAVLQCITDTGEEHFPGWFVHEPKVKGGSGGRRGLNTNKRSKLMACSKFKQLIESRRMTVHSRPLLKEMKSYVGSGDSFAAKIGETDDLISATLLCVRVVQIVAQHDENLYEQMNDTISVDEYNEMDSPMPMFL